MQTQATAGQLVGRRVRAMREARGWTQQELASRIREPGFEWQQSTVAKTEAARRPVSVDDLYWIARAFGETMTSLLADPSDEGPGHRLLVAQDNYEVAWARVLEAEKILQERKFAFGAALLALEEARAAVDTADEAPRGDDVSNALLDVPIKLGAGSTEEALRVEHR